MDAQEGSFIHEERVLVAHEREDSTLTAYVDTSYRDPTTTTHETPRGSRQQRTKKRVKKKGRCAVSTTVSLPHGTNFFMRRADVKTADVL